MFPDICLAIIIYRNAYGVNRKVHILYKSLLHMTVNTNMFKYFKTGLIIIYDYSTVITMSCTVWMYMLLLLVNC